ncbi:MAG: hypothetical protein HUJ26_18725 [Planctomycetaceae bacterium]|nr:hypothetical protein [Planctomycetaceae bacterium]
MPTITYSRHGSVGRIAAAMSAVVPGSGTVYNGQPIRGTLMLLIIASLYGFTINLGPGILLLAFPLHLVAVLDADRGQSR